jgi:hypothetical protein
MTNGGFSLSTGGLMAALWLFLGIRRSSMKQLPPPPVQASGVFPRQLLHW